ncbi:MAG: ATP-binding protein [Gallionella sp.]|nr:ATP-binding protein [Gallionella sp.]
MSLKNSLPDFSRNLWLTMGLFVVVSVTFGFYAYLEKQVDHANELRLQSFLLADELRQSSDDLTRMVRTYVVTGDPLYKQHYREILDIREGRIPRPVAYGDIYWDLVLADNQRPRPRGQAAPLLELMRQAGFTEGEFARLAQAKANSDMLTRPEFAAMALIESTVPVSEDNRLKANRMLNDASYHQAKYGIMRPISECYQMMEQRTSGSVHAAERLATLVRLMLIAFGLLLAFTLWRAYRALYATLGCSVDELQGRIASLGRGEFFSVIPVARGMDDSVLGWLSAMQINLAQLDAGRRQVEDELRKTQSNLIAAQKLAAIGSWEWDVRNDVANWSDETYRIFGIDKDELKAHRENFLDMILAEDRGKVDQALTAALSGESQYDIEYRVCLADGTNKVIHARAEIIRDAEAKPTVMTGTVQDITQRKHAEEELRHYKDHLEEEVQQRTADLVLALNAADAANRAKSVFLANMSHELRTPLNAVLGFSGMMRNDPLLSKGQRENLDIINRSGEYLLALINDVLEMARIEAGRVQLESAPIDLGALVLDVTEMMQLRAQQKGLQLRVDQSSAFPRYIRGDEARLRQILINLVGNAVKFTRQGGVTVRFCMKPNVTPQRLLIEIEDTGPGIRLDDKEKIFEPFVQVGEAAAQKGTGLGLTITRQFVQLMGGTISLESTFGLGATFRVELPVELADSAEVVTSAAAVKGEIVGLAPGQPEHRILIVEDQPENQLLLSQLMARIGLPVRVAGNGEQALALFERWHPDLIWMDRRMPVMDGLEAARRIRQLPGGTEVKIVAVTASAFKEQRDEMLAAGMDDFVRKPYRFNEIYNCLANQLGVQYTYAQALSAEDDRDMVLTEKVMSALPERLRCELHEALESLEDARIRAIIGQIGDTDLQKSLIRLADNYDYPAILKALQTN